MSVIQADYKQGSRAKPPAAGDNEVWGANPQAAGRCFCNFLEKTYFNDIKSHFAHVQNHLKEVDF